MTAASLLVCGAHTEPTLAGWRERERERRDLFFVSLSLSREGVIIFLSRELHAAESLHTARPNARLSRYDVERDGPFWLFGSLAPTSSSAAALTAK